MKHIYVIKAWYSDIHQHVELRYCSSEKKAEKYQKLLQQMFKKHPEMGVTEPKEHVTISKEILW